MSRIPYASLSPVIRDRLLRNCTSKLAAIVPTRQYSAERRVGQYEARHIDLLDPLLRPTAGTPLKTREYLKAFTKDLGLLSQRNQPTPTWEIQIDHVEHLIPLPPRLPHSGNYEWIGQPGRGNPRWLWDSHESRTVRANESSLWEGYVAISYTWGRWQKGQRSESGTFWPLPTFDPKKCDYDLSYLKAIMKGIPAVRYFWVDVLCIDQTDVKEREEEVAKIGAIFENAKQVVTYLWNMASGDDLAHALCSLGDLILWSSQVSERGCQKPSKYASKRSEIYQEAMAVKLQFQLLCSTRSFKWRVASLLPPANARLHSPRTTRL